MHAHHSLGFIELEPLAIGLVDLVYLIVALMCLLVVCAGWVILYLLHITLGKVSIFGAHPFNFFYGLATDALKSIFGQLEKRLVATAHFFWGLAQMVWRPLYVILAVTGSLLEQIVGVNQGSQQGLAQVRAKEQNDINTLDGIIAAESDNLQNQLNALKALEAGDFAQLQGQEALDFRVLSEAITSQVAGATTNLTNLINGDVANITRTINADVNTINTRITDSVNTINANVARDVTDLKAADATDLSTAKTFALQSITAATPGIIAKAEAAIQTKLTPIQTELTDCLDPLCNTVTPNAKRLGHLGDLFKNLEALGIEALLVALAAECLTDPGAVVNDVRTVTEDIGNPLMQGFRDLIGA